jgi:redox-sensitive bicupin YhaK (pirin superfamily)
MDFLLSRLFLLSKNSARYQAVFLDKESSMQPLANLITSRTRDLGGFGVRRILPAAKRKLVGPFIFLDHMGPATFAPGEGMDVRPHPHIGLATVTYLFEGAIFHRDSLGFEQVIHPGDINWMTAGSGIVHSERTPPEERQRGSKVEGLQCWVALPKEHEETNPSFVHHPKTTLPSFEKDDVSINLLVGDLFDKISPVKAHSDIVYAELKMTEGTQITLPADLRELGVYVATGTVDVGGNEVTQYNLGIGKVGQDLEIKANHDSTLMLIGGKPLPESREIWWNFVSSSNDRIERAKADWREGRFGMIPSDNKEFIPLPDEPSTNPPGAIL